MKTRTYLMAMLAIAMVVPALSGPGGCDLKLESSTVLTDPMFGARAEIPDPEIEPESPR